MERQIIHSSVFATLTCLSHLHSLELTVPSQAGEKDPFPYPDALLCGFNQLLLACALRDVPRAQRSTSIPEFIATWGVLPLSQWGLKLDLPAEVFTADERLLDPECDSRPTQLYQRLSRGEAMPSAEHALRPCFAFVKRPSRLRQFTKRRWSRSEPPSASLNRNKGIAITINLVDTDKVLLLGAGFS